MTSAAAARQRLHRERERAGRLVVSIEIGEAEISLLVEADVLDARLDFFTREDLAAAVERFLLLASRHA